MKKNKTAILFEVEFALLNNPNIQLSRLCGREYIALRKRR